MTSTTRRLIKLQHEIHRSIRAEVRRVLGPQPKDIRQYYQAYKREFQGALTPSNKEELLRDCFEANVIMMGDYHTFPQSQKAALRLLAELENQKPNITLALEMFSSDAQPFINAFLAGDLTEEELLNKIQYSATWGFSWDSFGKIIRFAKQNGLQVIGLNKPHSSLRDRDVHAAKLISNYMLFYPDRRIFVFYGDLHLAKSHLPRQLQIQARNREIQKLRILTIFQNSESVYWRLGRQGLIHNVDVVKLNNSRYCIMNAAPWVKLQSALEGHSDETLFDTNEPTSVAATRLDSLAATLEIQVGHHGNFEVRTVESMDFLTHRKDSPLLTEFTLTERKQIHRTVLLGRTAFIPGPNYIFVPSPTVNSLAEGAGLFAFWQLSQSKLIYGDPFLNFYSNTVCAAIGFFSSKIINHKRKCDLEDDFRIQAQWRLTTKALPEERISQLSAKAILKHIDAYKQYLRGKTYRQPYQMLGFRAPKPRAASVAFETARRLGYMMGERLFQAFTSEKVSLGRIQKLYRTNIDNPKTARDIFLQLIEALEEAPVGHTSKLDLF